MLEVGDNGVHTLLKSIRLNVKPIAQMEFELTMILQSSMLATTPQ